MAAAAAALCALDAFLVEPVRIEVTRHTVRGRVQAPLRLAHLSDLHTPGLGRRERRLLALLGRERPDAIVITGDAVFDGALLGRGWRKEDPAAYEPVRALLGRMRAPLGVFLVHGNWENWRRLPGERGFYAAAGVRLLVNEAHPLRPDVWLVGLDDPWRGEPDVAAARKGVPAGAFEVALFHSPALFDRLPEGVELALAGHTHGGQVRPPLLPVLWLPPGAGRYVAGWYARGASRLHVSRGVGTSTLPVRFRCRPELAMITVVPA
jgi:hypothetical protein